MGIGMRRSQKSEVRSQVSTILLLVACFTVISLVASGQAFTQQALAEPNSVYDEQSPMITPDGKILYFTVAGHPSNVGGKKDMGDIWYSNWDGVKWGPAIHGGPVINNEDYNAVIGFSHDGQRMFLANNYHSTSQGISISHKKGNDWATPEYIHIPEFKNRSTYTLGYFSTTVEAYVFSGEPFFHFGSETGAEDIFVALLINGEWQVPISLGPKINTHLQEWAPSLSDDGKILYFSSNGHKGFGSFDVFWSERLDDSWTNWSTPVNMGANVNTEGRELNYRTVPAAKLAIYTSTQNSDGFGDIKVYSPPPPPNPKDSVKAPKDSVKAPVTPKPETVAAPIVAAPIVEIVKEKPVPAEEKLFRVFGRVTDGKTGNAIPALVEFRGDTMITVTAKRDGRYEVRFPPVGEYGVSIEAPGYIGNFEKLDVRTLEVNSLELNFKLQPIEIGATVNLKSVLFQQGTPNLLPESNEELDEVVEFLKLNPKVEIELSGHTDNRGVHEHNVNLSKKRVEVVKAYLVSKGISGRRISGKGHGGSKPIADNKTEATRRLNRRVEFTIVKD
jgi:OOP family OmpA-OmpF porin